jgi:hypothetical protein
MKQHITLFAIVLFAIGGNIPVVAQLSVSGLLDSSVSLRAGAGDAPAFSYGVEEYANLRLQAKIRDVATIYGAFNFIAAAGDSAAMGEITGLLVSGQNYAAAIELERLYFRLNGESVDFDGGLLRLPFGYGQIWGSSDFLNPRNPLIPDARPRAVLGGGLSWYPKGELKLLAFGAAPRNPLSQSGEGGLVGLSMDQHWDKASLQVLYAFESPQDGSNKGVHRAGMSVKADIEIGLVMDALYTYNHEAGTKHDGLSFSFGADYSFFGGDLIVLAEYLYNGETSSTRDTFSNEHYLYTGFTWRFNDFTNISAALVSCFDDISFTPIISLNHDLFQGATLILTAQIPLDRDLFYGNGKRGELGPIPPGYNMGRYFDFNAKLRLRF